MLRVSVVALLCISSLLADDDRLACSVEKLRAGDKFTAKDLPLHHIGWTFAIGGVSNDIQFLISFDRKVTAKYSPPISSVEFGKMKQITIDTATAKGVPMDTKSGRVLGPARKIFTRSDMYQLIVSGNLASENAGAKNCFVDFTK